MTINQKKSLVAFYISKFNDDAFGHADEKLDCVMPDML